MISGVELEPTFAETTELHIGHPDHPVVSLTSHDRIQNGLTPWNQVIFAAVPRKKEKLSTMVTGQSTQKGTYEVGQALAR